jgi:hypothetical protein
MAVLEKINENIYKKGLDWVIWPNGNSSSTKNSFIIDLLNEDGKVVGRNIKGGVLGSSIFASYDSTDISTDDSQVRVVFSELTPEQTTIGKIVASEWGNFSDYQVAKYYRISFKTNDTTVGEELFTRALENDQYVNEGNEFSFNSIVFTTKAEFV